LVYGGETVVHLSGSGRGGRNQELALRVALEMETRGLVGDWVCLCAGTDGRDGPTDAAGGLVGPDTLARMRAAGISPEAALAQNDSNPALSAGLALVTVGETGTNVADLAVLIRGKA
jgi:hydroxypyruvate reductase